jgi:uncharacterized protein (UPF0335 family)
MSDPGGVAADQLRAFIERIERLEEEKKVISDDIKDVYAEAKGNGYDVKILRKVVSLRKKQPHEREEEEAVLDLYLHALGMAGSWAFRGLSYLSIQKTPGCCPGVFLSERSETLAIWQTGQAAPRWRVRQIGRCADCRKDLAGSLQLRTCCPAS